MIKPLKNISFIILYKLNIKYWSKKQKRPFISILNDSHRHLLLQDTFIFPIKKKENSKQSTFMAWLWKIHASNDNSILSIKIDQQDGVFLSWWWECDMNGFSAWPLDTTWPEVDRSPDKMVEQRFVTALPPEGFGFCYLFRQHVYHAPVMGGTSTARDIYSSIQC